MDIFGKKRLKEKVNKLKKFQIKETYGVDHFAAFGITCQCRNPLLFMFTLPMVEAHFRCHLNLELLYFVSSFLNYYITKEVLIYQKCR